MKQGALVFAGKMQEKITFFRLNDPMKKNFEILTVSLKKFPAGIFFPNRHGVFPSA